MNETLNKIKGKIGLKAECILETDEERQLVWNALEALEKAEKYRWHDLRKDPENLPRSEHTVEIACERYDGKGFFTLYAFYENGKVNSDESVFNFTELDEWADYCEETDCYIIPEGWFEHTIFAECFGVIDCKIIAWREIKPFEEVEE